LSFFRTLAVFLLRRRWVWGAEWWGSGCAADGFGVRRGGVLTALLLCLGCGVAGFGLNCFGVLSPVWRAAKYDLENLKNRQKIYIFAVSMLINL